MGNAIGAAGFFDVMIEAAHYTYTNAISLSRAFEIERLRDGPASFDRRNRNASISDS
jgi:hypothetical protein